MFCTHWVSDPPVSCAPVQCARLAVPSPFPRAGVSSELTLIWLGLPYIKERQLYSLQMPNKLNFGFDAYTFAALLAVAYVYGFPMVWLLSGPCMRVQAPC